MRKYLSMSDFSPTVPKAQERPSILDPYKGIIEGYLDEDARTWHKQRHTAKRIHDRFVQEHDAKVGYTTVQLYVKKRRAERRCAKDQYLKLVWSPGEAQVDFGEADFVVYGTKRRLHYLVVDFPFSNVGPAQVLFGENAECVCQGLLNVFDYIDGVPLRLVFDNATGVGRRIGESIRISDLFERFSCHFGFDYSFCNPYAGHEKGAVENKAGASRRNLFVPVPRIYDVEKYDARLLDACMERSDKDHYAKGESERALFMEDALTLLPMPQEAFDAVSYSHMKCDKYGYVCLDGNHRYAADPSLSKRTVIVGRRAFDVDIYTEEGELVSTHKRSYGKAPTSSDDPLSQLNVLCVKPAAWENSQVRRSLPQDLMAAMDAMERTQRSDALRCLRDVAAESGYAIAVDALASSYELLGEVDRASVEVMATCASSGAEAIVYDDPADLDVYDTVYGKGGEEHGMPA